MDVATSHAGNLTPKGRRQRLALGLIAHLAALGLLVWIVTTQPPWPARLWIAVPLLVAGLGLFQAREGT
mgnify:CR=1 FL=1